MNNQYLQPDKSAAYRIGYASLENKAATPTAETIFDKMDLDEAADYHEGRLAAVAFRELRIADERKQRESITSHCEPMRPFAPEPLKTKTRRLDWLFAIAITMLTALVAVGGYVILWQTRQIVYAESRALWLRRELAAVRLDTMRVFGPPGAPESQGGGISQLPQPYVFPAPELVRPYRLKSPEPTPPPIGPVVVPDSEAPRNQDKFT